MAQEAARGCGYRKVGGIYLVAGGLWADCDRLPFAVGFCPTCHGGIKFPRAPLEIDPVALFGVHDPCTDKKPHPEIVWVNDTPAGEKSVGGCQACFPQKQVAYLLGVGEQSYKTPGDFTEEAVRLGVSKRIAQIPKKLEVGKTWIYLVHRKGLMVPDDATGEMKPQLAVFSAFRPQRIEKIMWKSQAAALNDKEKKELERRGITVVEFDDNDPDHTPK